MKYLNEFKTIQELSEYIDSYGSLAICKNWTFSGGPGFEQLQLPHIIETLDNYNYDWESEYLYGEEE